MDKDTHQSGTQGDPTKLAGSTESLKVEEESDSGEASSKDDDADFKIAMQNSLKDVSDEDKEFTRAMEDSLSDYNKRSSLDEESEVERAIALSLLDSVFSTSTYPGL
jgi:hypothetical protein